MTHAGALLNATQENLGDTWKQPQPAVRAGKGLAARCESPERFIRRHQGREASPDEPPVRTKCGLVEARGVEPLSEDRQCTVSTCVADNLSFAAIHARRQA